MSNQNRKAVWGKHTDTNLVKPPMCAEDLEALPEILQAAEDSGKLSIVTDWLEKHGHGSSGSSNEILRPLIDLALAAESGGVRLVLECAALALDLDIATKSRSLSAIAVRYGITRQSVDRRFKRICSDLNINDTIVSKKKSASATYRLTNHRHEKIQKQ